MFKCSTTGEVKPFGVEMAAAPSLHVAVFRITRIGHDREKSLISGDATHILRGSCSGAVDAGRQLRLNVERQQLLDFHRVTPVVAEIVSIGERHPVFAAKVSQRDLAFVKQARAVFERHILDIRVAIAQTADAKLVKVSVSPIESRLDRQMKLVETPAQRHNQSSPDQRLDVIDRDAKSRSVEFLAKHALDLLFAAVDVNSPSASKGEFASKTRNSGTVGRGISSERVEGRTRPFGRSPLPKSAHRLGLR